MLLIKILKNNTWLGARGTRTVLTPGEWVVSYHGIHVHKEEKRVQGIVTEINQIKQSC